MNYKCESCGAEVPEDQITTIVPGLIAQKVCLDCCDAYHHVIDHE